jgi:hypothetical protein
MVAAPKDVLKNYLQGARDVLLWKLEGLSERDQRLPRTPTGTNSNIPDATDWPAYTQGLTAITNRFDGRGEDVPTDKAVVPG